MRPERARERLEQETPGRVGKGEIPPLTPQRCERGRGDGRPHYGPGHDALCAPDAREKVEHAKVKREEQADQTYAGRRVVETDADRPQTERGAERNLDGGKGPLALAWSRGVGGTEKGPRIEPDPREEIPREPAPRGRARIAGQRCELDRRKQGRGKGAHGDPAGKIPRQPRCQGNDSDARAPTDGSSRDGES